MSAPDALVERMVAEGRHAEAIELLSTSNRESRDPCIEERLVALRRDASAHVDRPTSSRSWPPRVRDKFRGVVGIPEIRAAELTPELVRSGIVRHGGLLVRGLLSSARVEQLIEDRERASAAHDAHIDGRPVSETTPWFVPFDLADGAITREFVRGSGGVLAVDSPRALFDLIEAFEDAGIGELVTSFLGEPPLILAKKWTLRRVAPESIHDWHQDGAFMGRDVHSINVWVALSKCGSDVPGLDVVARRFNKIVKTGTDGAHFDWSVGQRMVERVARGRIVSPDFEPGDALLFDHLLLHRTGVRLEMTGVRYAIEAWFAAPSSYPEDQLPLVY